MKEYTLATSIKKSNWFNEQTHLIKKQIKLLAGTKVQFQTEGPKPVLITGDDKTPYVEGIPSMYLYE